VFILVSAVNTGINHDTILPYIKKLRRMGVSSTITLYAIRGLKGALRQEVRALKNT